MQYLKQHFTESLADSGTIGFIDCNKLLSFSILISFCVPSFMYEPSSLGRNMLSLIVLLFLVPMSFQFSVREIFNNYILLFSLAMAFASSFMPPSLTLVALIGVSAFLSVVVMAVPIY